MTINCSHWEGVASMKKFSISVFSIMLAISFFFINSVPVFADYDTDYFYVPYYSTQAYQYWMYQGYSMTTTHTSQESSTVNVPTHNINIGNTRYDFVCDEPSYTGDGYACYYRDRTNGQIYGSWEQATEVAYSESITETFTDVSGAKLTTLLNTSYTRPTKYIHDNRRITIGNNRMYFVFLEYGSNFFPASSIGWYSYTGEGYLDIKREKAFNISNFKLYVFSMRQSNTTPRGDYDDYIINWPFNNNNQIVPIYIGEYYTMPDDIMRFAGLKTPNEENIESINSKIDSINQSVNQSVLAEQRQNSLVESGNSNSQSAQSALNSSNTTLNNKVDQMNNIETEYNSNLNDALDDIDISTDLVQHTGFTNAALWVSAQFNRLVIGTPFELVITFSLITGLALVLIGKMRG